MEITSQSEDDSEVDDFSWFENKLKNASSCMKAKARKCAKRIIDKWCETICRKTYSWYIGLPAEMRATFRQSSIIADIVEEADMNDYDDDRNDRNNKSEISSANNEDSFIAIFKKLKFNLRFRFENESQQMWWLAFESMDCIGDEDAEENHRHHNNSNSSISQKSLIEPDHGNNNNNNNNNDERNEMRNTLDQDLEEETIQNHSIAEIEHQGKKQKYVHANDSENGNSAAAAAAAAAADDDADEDANWRMTLIENEHSDSSQNTILNTSFDNDSVDDADIAANSSERIGRLIIANRRIRKSTTSSSSSSSSFLSYNCRLCGKRFAKSYTMRTHLRVHLREKIFACTWHLCSYRSEDRANVFHHVRAKHFDLPITKKQQAKMLIVDDRNAYDYIRCDDDDDDDDDDENRSRNQLN